jgi:hypothetical protein
MNEINLNMKEVVVKSETRPLRSEWSTELISDINTYYNTDTSDELERLLANEIKREIRKKKIEKILKHMA